MKFLLILSFSLIFAGVFSQTQNEETATSTETTKATSNTEAITAPEVIVTPSPVETTTQPSASDEQDLETIESSNDLDESNLEGYFHEDLNAIPDDLDESESVLSEALANVTDLEPEESRIHGTRYKHIARVPMRHHVPTHKKNWYNPWDTKPGGYGKEAYKGPMIYHNLHYNGRSLYTSYLSSGPYHEYAKHCKRSYGQHPKITVKDLDHAFSFAVHEVSKLAMHEKANFQRGMYLNASVHGSAARHQVSSYLRKNNPLVKKEKEALLMEHASKFLMKHHCLSKYEAAILLPQVKLKSMKNPYGDHSCHASYGTTGAKDLRCDPHSKYRSIDGSCNNLYHKYWGKSHVCHLRLLVSAYDDGLSHPRTKSITGKPLPSPRTISNHIHNPVKSRSYYTHMKMQWGQYINHDITHTPMAQTEHKGMIKCCPKPNHPQCFPIHIPPHDYQYKKYKKTCMNFVRSTPCPLCSLGPRQQINIGTSFLDNSATYGSTQKVADSLRTFKHGLLVVSHDLYGAEILPYTKNPANDQCSSPHRSLMCFHSGDRRVNQHPGIQVLHNLWHRRHNQHARALRKVNPHWSDEKLFQEARRLNIAELQHITYNEYLPIVFGPTLMKYYNLHVMHHGYSQYEPYTDPTTWNEYATAACRFGHSQISSFFSVLGYAGHKQSYVSHTYNKSMKGYWLRDWFFNPVLITDGWTDALIKGLVHDPAMLMDPWIDTDVHNYLYRNPMKERSGSDLPAFNIQRGRDHGIPPYHAFVTFCFGIKIYYWKDLEKLMPPEQILFLSKLYPDVRDIDLFTGMLSEKKFPDADVGPTTACILGIQYYHLKFGDRFFYTHGYQKGSFSPAQLDNIRRVTTLAGFLCKTTDKIHGMQKNAFLPAAGYNPKVHCKHYPEINYRLWMDQYHG